MRRIALVLALLALTLGAPVAWLVARSLEAERFQRDVRHETVANRIFDEMERALSELLLAEEARPFEAYRGDGLARLLAEDALGLRRAYFERGPDGALRARSRSPGPATPPEDGATGRLGRRETVEEREQEEPAKDVHETKRLAKAEPAATDVRQQIREGLDRPHRRDRPGEAPHAALAGAPPAPAAREPTAEDARPEPARRAPLPGVAPTAGRPAARRADADAAGDESEVAKGLYAALDRLNLGSEARRERRQKVSEQTLGSAAGAGSVAAVGDSATAEAGAPARRSAAPPPPASAAGKEAEPARVRVVVDPMVGRRSGDGGLLLYRTVFVGERAYRQGLLVDAAGLAHRLVDRVLAPTGLGAIARPRFALDGEPLEGFAQPDPARDAYRFSHRFGEPFDALSVSLALAPLPEADASATIRLLAVLLAVGGVVGGVAVYRMVSVVVHFAERRNNFVASVTHELKTPLTAIRMYAEMLRDGLVPDDRKREEYYATIGDESERLSRLIDNVLEFSKLEKGQRAMALHAGSLEPVVHEACETLRPHAERSGFALRLDVADELPPVRFDRDAVIQVLFNLVDNAMKYAGREHPEVVLSLARRGDAVALAVRDRGPGVPGPQLSRIFEPFYRGGSELTRSTRGTGIGLALVKELGERMGARVSGRNPEEGGFEVVLVFEPA